VCPVVRSDRHRCGGEGSSDGMRCCQPLVVPGDARPTRWGEFDVQSMARGGGICRGLGIELEEVFLFTAVGVSDASGR